MDPSPITNYLRYHSSRDILNTDPVYITLSLVNLGIGCDTNGLQITEKEMRCRNSAVYLFRYNKVPPFTIRVISSTSATSSGVKFQNHQEGYQKISTKSMALYPQGESKKSGRTGKKETAG